MKKVIYKYTVGGALTYYLPEGAEVVHVGMEDGAEWPSIWAMVDADAEPTVRYDIVGTGHPLQDGDVPVGSVIMPPFVWHVVKAGQ